MPPTSRRALRLHHKRVDRRRRTPLVFAGVLLVILVAAMIMIATRSEPADQPWHEGETHGNWTVRYTGFGQVTSDGDRITLEPRSAADLDVTHGGLVHTTGQCRDANFSMTVNTESQVRQDDPNVWEVGWVLWNFESDTQFYAVALKPNGWEISKQDPDYEGNQRFLASGDTPTFPVGHDYRVTVTQDDGAMTVSVDGEELDTVTDTQTPYRQGSIGLYTEDARVHFSDFDLPDCARAQ